MIFEQFYLGCLAHASYLIGSDGVAAVVDVRIYLDTAATLGLRALPDENMPGFYDLMRKVIGDPAVQVVPNNRNARPAGAPSRIDTDIYRAIEAANRKVYNVPTIPQMSTGATDMSLLRSKGTQCYGVGPASDMEDAAEGFGAHSNQERLLEDFPE